MVVKLTKPLILGWFYLTLVCMKVLLISSTLINMGRNTWLKLFCILINTSQE